MKSKTRSNPPTAKEIADARESLRDVYTHFDFSPDDPMPGVMDDGWKGEGWHKDEIWLGILVGLEIARARRERVEEKIPD
jgi:hypothetical protein